MFVLSVIVLLLSVITQIKTEYTFGHTEDICDTLLNYKIRNEIASYQSFVDLVLNKTMNGNYKGQTYKKFTEFVKQYARRPLGSKKLDDSIKYVVNSTRKEKVCVCTERLPVPKWERGTESLELLTPFKRNLTVLGVGLSVGTPEEGITAPVLVVESFDDLQKKSILARNKIIVVNNYQQSLEYETKSAIFASKYGALAVLIPSSSYFNSPHPGIVEYNLGPKKIPAARITPDDAKMFQKLSESTEIITVKLIMQAQTKNITQSKNTIVKILGRQTPQKSVIISGHLDTWDIGNQVLDEGVGAFLSWLSVLVLQEMKVEPKRTIQAVLWTGDEMGFLGARAYVQKHFNRLANVMVAMEAGDGGFGPMGIQYKSGKTGGCILQEIMKLYRGINATRSDFTSNDFLTELDVFQESGVPTALLHTSNHYWYEDSSETTPAPINSADLDKSLGLWASLAYILADLSIDFPRHNNRLSIFDTFGMNSYNYKNQPVYNTITQEPNLENLTTTIMEETSTDDEEPTTTITTVEIENESTTHKKIERLVDRKPKSRGLANTNFSMKQSIFINSILMCLLIVVVY